MKSPRRTVDLRQVNYQAVLRSLYFHGPMSRLDLSNYTQLSPGTITNLTAEMLAEGLLVESGSEESLGGRPRTLLEINPDYGYLIGIDLGETHVQSELFDLKRRKLATARCPISPAEGTPQRYVTSITEGVESLLAQHSLEHQAILGVGVGVPGIVEHHGPVSVAAPMWGWQSVPLLEMLESALHLPCYIDNGAKAMALAESWFGAGRGVQDVIVILIGTGIGAGIVTKGALYRGATNSAGEWGHTKIVLDGRLCRCGSRGCLEAYAGAPGILATVQELDPARSLPESQQAALAALIQGWKEGDPIARQALQQVAHMLGAGMANLVNLFNPERVIFGGWAGMLLSEILLDEIRQAVQAYSLPLSVRDLRFGVCDFGQDAVCMGAACLVLEEFLSLNQKFTRKPLL